MAIDRITAPRGVAWSLLLFQLSSSAALSASLSIGPAAISVPVSIVAGAPLHEAETLQLTDSVITRIATDEATKDFAGYFAFEYSTIANTALAAQKNNASCKSFPGDPTWPTKPVWDSLNALLGNALIPTVPVAASCYDTAWGPKNSSQCANVIANFTNPLFHEDDPTSTMWPIFQGRTCMPSNSTAGKQCTKGGYPEYAVKVANVAQIQLAVNFARNANLRLVIKNTGHCYLGKSSGAGALSLWMHGLKEIEFLPDFDGLGYRGPALKLAAGVTVREVYEAADRHGVTVTGAVSWVRHFSYDKSLADKRLLERRVRRRYDHGRRSKSPR